MESTPPPVLPGEPAVRRSGRRRRPTGAPPPLPRSIQTTGVWWAVAALVLVVLARIAFGPARSSLGVAITVWDDAVVQWMAALRLPGLTGLMEAIVASTGSVGMVEALRWATVIALLALRRFRHLLVFVGSFLAVLLLVRLATVDRPRPFRRGRSPSSPRRWSGSSTRWSRWVAGGNSANGSRPDWSRRSLWPGSTSAWTLRPTRSWAPSSGSRCRWRPTGCSCPTRSSRSTTSGAAAPTSSRTRMSKYTYTVASATNGSTTA